MQKALDALKGLKEVRDAALAVERQGSSVEKKKRPWIGPFLRLSNVF